MREIKYRAWDKDHKEMLRVHSIHLNTQKVILTGICFGGNRSVPFDEIELMEYTGLKDKNGKEIFEGDILEGNIANLVVAYEGATFIAYWLDHDYGYGKEKMWCNLVEGGNVIGNIHENPELLER